MEQERLDILATDIREQQKLNELRSFRHIFRHAYGAVLEPQKFKFVLQKALILKKIYKKDVANFLKQLEVKKNR